MLLVAAAPLKAAIGFGTIEDDPELVKARIRQKVEDDYKEGMKAKAEGRTETAVRVLLQCAKTRCDSQYPELAFNELKAFQAQANQELEVARQLIAGEDPAAGLSELKRIVRIYFGLGPAKDAGALQRQLEADPQFQSRLKAGRLTEELKKAEALEAQAVAILQPAAEKPAAEKPAAGSVPPPAKPDGVAVASVKPKEMSAEERRTARLNLLLDAYEAYGRIVQLGGDTEAAKKAAAARARLEKDADLMARIKQVQADRKAKELLGLADGYFRAGRLDLARQYCTKIIAECPGTQQAADAKALLERLK